MKIEIWSDFACPFCYIGEKKLEKALEDFEGKESVEIEFKSFQLNVNATSHPDEDMNALIAGKYGISYDEAKANNDRIVASAKTVGLDYDFDHIKPNNTGMAHEATKFAQTKGKANILVDRFFKAYFEEGYDIGNIETIIQLAQSVGFDPDELRDVLEKKQYKSQVIEDQQMAGQIGVQSVPFFVFDGKYAVSGAQDVAQFTSVINKVSQEA